MKIFGARSETKKSQSDVKSEQTLTGSLWARYRQLEARLSNTESKLSALRRDCDRIEKNQSRERNKPPTDGEHELEQTSYKLPNPFTR